LTVAVTRDDRVARVTVENSGPGIAPEDVDVLFEPFRRLPTSERIADTGHSNIRGAGLGLSIVRSVARAHGGSAQAVARPDGGLAVSVTVPIHDEPRE
jgi:signal transduction histidine kinase